MQLGPKGYFYFGHWYMLKCVTTSPLPYPQEWAQTWTGHNHICCLLCLVPLPILGAVRIIWEEEKDLQPFNLGLFSAVCEAGAAQRCCSISEEGLIKRLKTWSWTKQHHRFGNTLNKQNTNNQTNLFLLLGIYCVLFTSLLDLLYRMLPLDSWAEKAVLSI